MKKWEICFIPNGDIIFYPDKQQIALLQSSCEFYDWSGYTNRTGESICYGNGKWIVCKTTSLPNVDKLWYNTDITNATGWTLIQKSFYSTNHNISDYSLIPYFSCYGDSGFLIGGLNNVDINNTAFIMYSPDGTSFSGTTVVTGSTNGVANGCYGNGKYVVLINTTNSERIFYSTDMINWYCTFNSSVTTNGVYNILYDIIYADGKYVVVGSNEILTSTDAVNWTKRSSILPANSITHITYGNNKYLVGLNVGSVYYSTDGVSWNSGNTTGMNNSRFGLIDFINCKYVASFSSITGSTIYTIKSSTDGLNWISESPPYTSSVSEFNTNSSNILGTILMNNGGIMYHIKQ